MASPTFRKEMIKAWSFPALVFVLTPSLAILFGAPSATTASAGLLLSVMTLLVPAFLVGFALAPWAGRQVRTTKGPAFAMAAVAALSSAAILGLVSQSLATAAFIALFALPASLIGALMFIGACERAITLASTTSGAS